MPIPIDLMRAFLGNSLDLLCVASAEGFITWANPAWERTLGYSLAELSSEPFLSFVHPDDVDATLAAMAKLTEGHPVTHFVNRYRHHDGGWRSLEWMTQPAADGQWICIARDITHRRATQAAAARRVEQLLMAEELAQVGHWRLDAVTTEVYWSPHVFRIHGRDPAKGVPAVDEAIAYYHPDDRDRVTTLVNEAIGAGKGYEFRCRLIRDDGVERHVVSRAHVGVNDAGEPVEVFGVFQDVTDQIRFQERLRHAEKLASIGTLAAGVAHEINNPLSYVHLNLQVLMDDLQRLDGSASQRTEMLETIDDARDGVDRIRRIVGGLKGFSKAHGTEMEVVEIGRVVRSALRLCANEADQTEAVLVESPDGELYVEADEGQLVQVVLNLVMNAIQSGPRVRVLVRTRGRDGRVHIEVVDNGAGMDATTQSQVLEPFFTTKGKSVGTGLGLYVCKGIVDAHHGTIRVASEVGVGTTMTIDLPRVARPSPSVGGSTVPSREAGTVLVVDDQLRVARSLARALRPLHVDVCTQPTEAVAMLNANPVRYDLIICDLMMPELRGEQVYEAVPMAARQRMVFMTGGAFTPGSHAFAERMGERVLPKPPDRDHIRRLVEARRVWAPMDASARDEDGTN